MTNAIILQMPLFKRAYKKLHDKEKIYVDNTIKSIAKNPKIGALKKGDLAGIFVHKFKIYNQLMLLAYEVAPPLLTLLAMGPHENFYRDLKRI